MAPSKLRSSSFLPALILSSMNFTLLLLSAASLVPIILLRHPPTTFGWALAATSSLAILTSFVGFYMHLSHCCFSVHVSLLLTSVLAQALGFCALFRHEDRSLEILGSRRSLREGRFLLKVEETMVLGMLLLQSLVLVLSCVVQSCWVREFEGLGAEREETARRRSRRMAQVQEESLANAAAAAETKARELDEKMKSKYGQWTKIDLEG